MRHTAWLVIPALLALGCPDPEVPTLGSPDTVWVELVLTLDSDTAVAGQPVGYSAVLVSDYGGREPVDAELGSDLEASLAFDTAELTATVAGEHAITATVTRGEQSFDAGATLTVTAAALASLDLVLASSTALAGEWVDYTVTAADPYGNAVPAEPLEVTSDGSLDIDDDRVRGMAAGDWTVTAASGSVTDHEPLTVLAGEVAEVDLVLSSGTVAAGGTVTWSATYWDAHGNEIPTAQSTVTADDAAVVISGNDITSSVVGTYFIRIDVEEGTEPWDSEVLIVESGEPASITLSLSPFPPEVDQIVTATADVFDAYGNPSAASWTLSVAAEPGSDPAAIDLNGAQVQFLADGEYSATATVDVNGVSDTVGPFLVDSFGPVIDVTHPARGSWSTLYDDTVTGTISEDWSGIAAATVNGAAVTLAQDDSFAHPITYDFGVNLIETLATDGDGNTSSDRRSVLVGDFATYGGGVADGVVARVNQGALDTLEVLGEDLIASQDIAGQIPDPVFYAIDEYCVNIWPFGTVCYTLYELTLRVLNPSLGTMDLELDPQGSGALYTSLTVYDVYVDWSASGVLSEIPYGASGSISADAITVSMNVWPSVSGGVINASVTDVSVSSQNFDFDFDSWIYDLAQIFGIDVDGMVQGYVEDAIRDAVEGEVPGLLEGVLQDLEIAADFPLEGNTYTFEAVPYSMSVDDDGISLSLETYFLADAWNSPYTGLGSLYADYSVPSYGATPGMVASLSGDFLNQALLAFWGGGLLELTFTAAELGLDPADFAFLPGNMANPQLVVSAMLPPVVVPGTNGHLLDLQLGDLEVALYGDDPSDPANLVLQFYVGLDAGLELTVTPQQTLAATITDVSTWFDVTYPVFPAATETDFEDLLDLMVPQLTPLLTDAIGEIPIPEFSGFTLGNVQIEAAGAEYGYVNAGGDLSYTP